MSAPPTVSDSGFISPLAPQLARFLALKHTMGYCYREEGRVLRDLDRFLNTRLFAADPLVTPAVVHDYVALRGAESETTRAHRLTLIREVCRFLRLDDARVVVPDRRSLRTVRQKFVPRVLSRDEGSRFLQACTQLPPGQGSPIRTVVLGTALRLLYLAGLRAGELLRLTEADLDLDTGALHIRPANSTNRGWCRSHRIWSSALFSAASLQRSATGPVARTHRCSPARTEVGIPSPRSAARFMTR